MPPDSTSWRNKSLTIPAGLIIALATLLITAGAAASGGVGIVTRNGDLSVVDEHIATAIAQVRADQARDIEQLRREQAAAAGAAAELATTRYDEVLRRLDRIEHRLDGEGR